MSTWQKFVVGVKFFFGGFDCAISYILKYLNDYLEKEDVAKNVQMAYATIMSVLRTTDKYIKYCPNAWLNEYYALRGALADCAAILYDGKVTEEEVAGLMDIFKTAKSRWETDEDEDDDMSGGVDEGATNTAVAGAIALLMVLLSIGVIVAGCQAPRASYANGLVLWCSASAVGVGFGQYAEVPAGGKFDFKTDTVTPCVWADGITTNSSGFAIDCSLVATPTNTVKEVK
jgi:hypothetical protein